MSAHASILSLPSAARDKSLAELSLEQLVDLAGAEPSKIQGYDITPLWSRALLKEGYTSQIHPDWTTAQNARELACELVEHLKDCEVCRKHTIDVSKHEWHKTLEVLSPTQVKSRKVTLKGSPLLGDPGPIHAELAFPGRGETLGSKLSSMDVRLNLAYKDVAAGTVDKDAPLREHLPMLASIACFPPVASLVLFCMDMLTLGPEEDFENAYSQVAVAGNASGKHAVSVASVLDAYVEALGDRLLSCTLLGLMPSEAGSVDCCPTFLPDVDEIDMKEYGYADPGATLPAIQSRTRDRTEMLAAYM